MTDYTSTRTANATIDELRERITDLETHNARLVQFAENESKRVAELEGQRDKLDEGRVRQNAFINDLAADNARLRELLRECVYELMPDAHELRERIDKELGK